VPERDDGEDWLSQVGPTDDGEEWFPGTVAPSHVDCGEMAVLVVTGAGSGRVAYTFWAGQAPAYTPDADFLTWYEGWLDAVLRDERHWW
jgi:hypothetical protein